MPDTSRYKDAWNAAVARIESRNRNRDGCCATWPKPCPYHRGYQDALDSFEQVGWAEVVGGGAVIIRRRVESRIHLPLEVAFWVRRG